MASSTSLEDDLNADERLRTAKRRFDRLDRVIADWMERLGIPTLRVGLGIVFIWFGGLKVVGGSPAAELVGATVYVVDPALFVPILGVWEVLIGLCLLYRPLIRLGILLLFLQMPGTFLPIVLLPEVVFVTFPFELTVEGQYIIKNLVIIGAALVVGGTVRRQPQESDGRTRASVDARPRQDGEGAEASRRESPESGGTGSRTADAGDPETEERDR